jgi:hypothetical protein
MSYKNFNAQAGKIEAGKCGATFLTNSSRFIMNSYMGIFTRMGNTVSRNVPHEFLTVHHEFIYGDFYPDGEYCV